MTTTQHLMHTHAYIIRKLAQQCVGEVRASVELQQVVLQVCLTHFVEHFRSFAEALLFTIKDANLGEALVCCRRRVALYISRKTKRGEITT